MQRSLTIVLKKADLDNGLNKRYFKIDQQLAWHLEYYDPPPSHAVKNYPFLNSMISTNQEIGM